MKIPSTFKECFKEYLQKMKEMKKISEDNAIPLFDFGKYFERDSKIILPFSVQVHHLFVDGIHIGKFYELLQKYLNNFA